MELLDKLVVALKKAQKDFFNSRGAEDLTYGIEVKEEKERAVITAYAEVGYGTLEKMCYTLDKVVEQYSSSGYFEPESAGRAECYIYYKYLTAEKVDWAKKFRELRTKDSLPSYEVVDSKGNKVKKGDLLTSFKGDKCTFEGCYHPRKITVRSGKELQEYYPSVFGVKIVAKENLEDAKIVSPVKAPYDKISAKTKKDSDGNFVLKAYKNGEVLPDYIYVTDDWNDMVSYFKKEVEKYNLKRVLDPNRLIALVESK